MISTKKLKSKDPSPNSSQIALRAFECAAKRKPPTQNGGGIWGGFSLILRRAPNAGNLPTGAFFCGRIKDMRIQHRSFSSNVRKGLKQSFGMDKTGPNPPTRRDHLIPPVPRAKQLPPAGTNMNQKGCLVCNKNKPSRSAAQRRASKETSGKQHQASRASSSSALQPKPDPPPGPRPPPQQRRPRRSAAGVRSAAGSFRRDGGQSRRVKSLSQIPRWVMAYYKLLR